MKLFSHLIVNYFSHLFICKMNFKEEIKKRGLKLSFVADLIGVSSSELSMYLNESRKMPEKIEESLKKAIAAIPIPTPLA